MVDEKWDRRFLNLAKEIAKFSKDPSTKVGALIVSDKKIIGQGYNGLPKRIADTDERLNNRELKLQLVIHAEINAVLDSAGADLTNATMYMVAINVVSKEIWGGAPCIRCLSHIMQTDLNRIVTFPFKSAPSRWRESLVVSRKLMDEVGMSYVEYNQEY